MARLGYYNDDFLRVFVRKPSRRSPLINRGYYIRAKAVDTVIRRFIAAVPPSTPLQIVSLGAGFDTLYFRLRTAELLRDGDVVFEMDFPTLLKRKLAL